jgi:3',5'-cyclic AMP phosphodiesterase CpdA
MRTIAHISDIHFGKINMRAVEGLVADLAGRTPSLVVVSGDLTQRARAEQYRQAAEFLARIPRPQLVVPGNHDIPLYNVVHRFGSPLKNYCSFITRDLAPVYRDDEMLVVGLNTARPLSFSLLGFWKDGRISPKQLDWMRQAIADVPASVFKVAVTHHPFVPPSIDCRREIIGGAGPALATMEQCGVELLLAGHLHTGYHGDVRTYHLKVKRSILSLQAGTTTSTRLRDAPNSYNWITIDAEKVSIEVRAWDGRKFHTSTTAAIPRCQSGSGK